MVGLMSALGGFSPWAVGSVSPVPWALLSPGLCPVRSWVLRHGPSASIRFRFSAVRASSRSSFPGGWLLSGHGYLISHGSGVPGRFLCLGGGCVHASWAVWASSPVPAPVVAQRLCLGRAPVPVPGFPACPGGGAYERRGPPSFNPPCPFP